jgi:hypothetical protein
MKEPECVGVNMMGPKSNDELVAEYYYIVIYKDNLL